MKIDYLRETFAYNFVYYTWISSNNILIENECLITSRWNQKLKIRYVCFSLKCDINVTLSTGEKTLIRDNSLIYVKSSEKSRKKSRENLASSRSRHSSIFIECCRVRVERVWLGLNDQPICLILFLNKRPLYQVV